MTDRRGTLLAGRYQLLDVIGRGGHSVVYRARDRTRGEDVAVKLLHATVAADSEHTVRLVREHRAMTELADTAAVKALGMVTSPEGALCLIMELLQGQDLDDRLLEVEREGGRLGVEELVRVLGPIVDTLAAAHERGFLHRDLKPGNVFVIDEAAGGGVRLLDFGLAKVPTQRPLTRLGFVLGSPSYIAPEVWEGDTRALDHRVDIYALGAVVFRALGGRVPFEAPSLRDKMVAVKTAPRPSLVALRPELPAAVDPWVRQVLAIDRDQRFFHVRAAWGALLEALAEPAPSVAQVTARF